LYTSVFIFNVWVKAHKDENIYRINKPSAEVALQWRTHGNVHTLCMGCQSRTYNAKDYFVTFACTKCCPTPNVTVKNVQCKRLFCNCRIYKCCRTQSITYSYEHKMQESILLRVTVNRTKQWFVLPSATHAYAKKIMTWICYYNFYNLQFFKMVVVFQAFNGCQLANKIDSQIQFFQWLAPCKVQKQNQEY
jgi:hypothetical protein